jgi:uncharacterized membrane protein
MEAFSDGVIAVIITIMVLDLKVPEHDGLAAIWTVLPSVTIYLLSFVQVGIYWVNHHYLTDEIEEVSHSILWTNLAFLFCLSLIPFATKWAGEREFNSFSTALYSGACLLPGFSYTLLWIRCRKLADEQSHASLIKMVISTVLYVVAIPVAFWRPWASLLLICVVAVLWLTPPRERCPDPEGLALGGQ